AQRRNSYQPDSTLFIYEILITAVGTSNQFVEVLLSAFLWGKDQGLRLSKGHGNDVEVPSIHKRTTSRPAHLSGISKQCIQPGNVCSGKIGTTPYLDGSVCFYYLDT